MEKRECRYVRVNSTGETWYRLYLNNAPLTAWRLVLSSEFDALALVSRIA